MEFYLLHVSDYDFFNNNTYRAAGITFLIATFTEAIVMFLMKYNRFSKTLLHSGIVNLASIETSFILMAAVPSFMHFKHDSDVATVLGATVVVEFIFLYLLNRNIPALKTFLVTLAMNVATWLLIYIIVEIVM